MNNIKHYILIRFYCVDMMEREKLFDINLLNNGVKVFKQYALKSLENQSNKNFEIILLIHDEIDCNIKPIKDLYEINSSIKLHIIRFNELRNFILSNIKKFDYLITSRMDHDDLIYNDAVNEIQLKCNENIPFYYNGYDKLITMINNDYLNTYKFYPNYNGIGSINIFQSVILNLNYSKQIKYNIFSLSHTKGKPQLMNWYKDNNLEFKDEYFNINHLEDSCIYVKHDFNHSTYQHELLNKKWHRTDIKVNKPKEWFIERFGNFID